MRFDVFRTTKSGLYKYFRKSTSFKLYLFLLHFHLAKFKIIFCRSLLLPEFWSVFRVKKLLEIKGQEIMQKLYTLPKRNYKWYFVRNCSKKVHESIHAFSTLQAKSQLIGFKYDIVSEGIKIDFKVKHRILPIFQGIFLIYKTKTWEDLYFFRAFCEEPFSTNFSK